MKLIVIIYHTVVSHPYSSKRITITYFSAIEEMESEIVQQRGGDNSHNNHVFNHLQQ